MSGFPFFQTLARIGRILPLVLFLCFSFSDAGAQVNEREKYRYKPVDSVHFKKGKNNLWRYSEIRATEKFDIIFSRSFTVGAWGEKWAPVSTAGSGAYFIGLGLNYVLSRRKLFTLKIEPGVSFHTYSFTQNSEKTFPTPSSDSLATEQIKAYFVELPIALRINTSRDTVKKRLTSYVELGISIGYKFNDEYKYSSKGGTSDPFILILPDRPEVNPFKAQVYARLVYRFIGIWATFRLTPYFSSTARWTYGVTDSNYPKMPPLEVGFSIML